MNYSFIATYSRLNIWWYILNIDYYTYSLTIMAIILHITIQIHCLSYVYHPIYIYLVYLLFDLLHLRLLSLPALSTPPTSTSFIYATYLYFFNLRLVPLFAYPRQLPLYFLSTSYIYLLYLRLLRLPAHYTAGAIRRMQLQICLKFSDNLLDGRLRSSI